MEYLFIGVFVSEIMKSEIVKTDLQVEQKYVKDISSKFGIDYEIVKHEMPTDTCFEKARLLNWPNDRVVKAVYLHELSGDKMYGFVFPEYGVDSPGYLSKEIMSEVLGSSKKYIKKLRSYYSPRGMEFGTCTPFILDDSFREDHFGYGLKNIFFEDSLIEKDSIVDISLGGRGVDSHKKSMHIKYGDIYSILKEQFGDRICSFSMSKTLKQEEHRY